MHKFFRIAKTFYCVATILMVGSSIAMGDMILEDTLDTSSGNRSQGDSLNDKKVEKYAEKSFEKQPVWLSSSNTTFANDGGVTAVRDGGSIQGLVAVQNQEHGQLTLKMDAKVADAEWVALGFLAANVPKKYGEYHWFHSGNLLFATLTQKGEVCIIRNGADGGTKNIVKAWTIKGFSKSAVYTFEFQYDRDTRTAIVKVNGMTVGSGIAVTDLNESTFGFVGFRSQGTEMLAGDTRISNFSYSIAP